MKKTIFTLNIGNYAPEITEITYPHIRKYAEKIGADFQVITDRKYPDHPIPYEKLQIKELGANNDWNIYIDSDALVHPDLFDVTAHLTKDTVLHWGDDMSGNRWRYDKYLLRDGRHIGSCNWFTVASDWCLDLWTPLDISVEEAVNNIFPTHAELKAGITREHLLDDYTLSRNLARFGLKFKTFRSLVKDLGQSDWNYFVHEYLSPELDKVRILKETKERWGI